MRQLFHSLLILSNLPTPNTSIHRLPYSKLLSPPKNDHFWDTMLISRLYPNLFSKEYILHSILDSLPFNTKVGSIHPFFYHVEPNSIVQGTFSHKTIFQKCTSILEVK